LLEQQFNKGNQNYQIKAEETINIANVILLKSRAKDQPPAPEAIVQQSRKREEAEIVEKSVTRKERGWETEE
jgi:hypothetical protein